MSKKLVNILFVLIIGIAAILRLYQLGAVPISPDWDEVALGYNAYSIIQTGKDEYGKAFPVVLRSYDDYKPALYMYLSIPFVYFLGLDTMAVRLPSTIAGIIATIAVYYLARELFEKSKKKDLISLATALFFAISPWSVQFSRIAFEANTGMLMNILTALFFVKGLKKPWMFSLSAIFAALSIYAYQSEKVFTPLLVGALVLIYFKDLLKLPRKYLIAAVVVGFIVVAPMLMYIFGNKESLLRVKGTSIFTHQTEVLSDYIPKLKRESASNDKLGLFLDNRRVVYGKEILSGYLSHFDPTWLFISGDISRHNAPNVGYLYLFEIPLILIGIYMLLFGDFDRRTKLIIFAWFLLTPVPASITTELPHPIRTLNFLPTWQIFSALGAVTIFLYIFETKRKKISSNILKVIFVGYVLFALFNFVYYLNQYFVQLNYYTAQQWQYGYEKAIEKVYSLKGQYSKVIVSDIRPMDRSYMFFLYYLKYPPNKYQKALKKTPSMGFAPKIACGKYEFRPIDWEKDKNLKNVLIFGTDAEIPDGVATYKIKNPDGSIAIEMVHQ